MDLLIATTNTGKAREIRSFLRQLQGLDIYSLADFPSYTPPEEVGTTFEENASLKAVKAAKALGMVTIADDSGLVVPALKGAPGVFSARYAGENATDLDNRKKLLLAMKPFTGLLRAAYMECAIAVATPEGLQKCVQGHCEGMILEAERGRKGFGYDPLFIKHDYALSFGELDENVKNQISHRAKAFEKLTIFLSSLEWS